MGTPNRLFAVIKPRSFSQIAAFANVQCSLVSAQTVVEYVHPDMVGSIVAISDASGQLIGQRTTYEPYGSQIEPSVQDGPGYTGHVQDAGTGLV